jgi:hypothetical protein
MKYFTKEELACRHCGLFLLHPGFGEALDLLREAVNRPLVVTSCCRCKYYNDLPVDSGGVGGHPESLHIFDFPAHQKLGQLGTLACDFAAVKGPERGELFAALWKLGWSVGWNAKRGFLHGDRRDWIGMKQTTFDY